MPRQTAAERDSELISEVLENFQDADAAESGARTLFTEDLKFLYEPGAQWDAVALARRQGRPNYSYNRVQGPVNQLIGDQRQQQPQITVAPASKNADSKKANTIAGMIRDILAQSSAPSIFNMQFKYAVSGGFGHWRVMPEFEPGEVFNQCLRLRDVPNPLTVYFDTSDMDPWKRNSMWCIVAERITKARYKAEYPDFDPWDFPTLRDGRGWVTDKEVRVAEYFKKVPDVYKIAELSDGNIVRLDKETRKAIEALATPPEGIQPVTIVRERKVNDWRIKWWKTDGANILEGPITYNWTKIPVVRIPGRYINIEGKPILASLHRQAKDAQRTYNYNRSTQVELASLTPRAPYLATAAMLKGHEGQWNNANTSNQPYLLYDVDPKAPAARPERTPPIEIAPAFVQLAMQDAEDIRATTGFSQAGLGEQGNERSGVALDGRQMESDVGAYEFTDNFKIAVQHTGEIMIDMIPWVYDTARTVRTVAVDGKSAMTPINGMESDAEAQAAPNAEDEPPVDLTDGSKYNCEVSIGPAYTTQRRNALDTLLSLGKEVPIFAELAPDLIAKNLDVQGADELEARVRKRLVMTGIVKPTKEEAAEMPPPPEPDPLQVATVQQLNAQAKKNLAEAENKNAETAKLVAELKGMLSGDGDGQESLNAESMMQKIIGQRLDNMIKAGELGIDSASGKLSLRQYHPENRPKTNGGAQK